MRFGDLRPPPTCGTIDGAQDIQTPSRVKHGLEGAFILDALPRKARPGGRFYSPVP
jgi:hypothetical protein